MISENENMRELAGRAVIFRKSRVEDCQKVNIFILNSLGQLKAPPGTYPHAFRVNGQEILLTKTSCYFGGSRYWFLCPDCDKRAGVLYRPWYAQTYLCRGCHNLTYTLRQVHRDSFYPIWRTIKMRERLIRVLEGIGQKGFSKREVLQLAKLKSKVEEDEALIGRTNF